MSNLEKCAVCSYSQTRVDLFGIPYYTCHHKPFNGIYSDTIECPLEKIKSKENKNKQ